MKKAKKLLLLLAVVVTAMVCFAVSASALDATGQCGENVYWEYNSKTKELVISGEGDMKDYVGDSDLEEDYESPFYGSAIRTVVIKNGVKNIGEAAFVSCRSLTSITIPDSVTSIGYKAFSWCESLKYITIPGSVNSIGVDVFYECKSLESITVDESNKNYSSDNYGVFFNKDKTELLQYPIGNKRTSYEILDSVTSIGYRAFYGCTSLTSITIPDSVTSIGYGAFYGCTSLTSITIPDSVTSIGFSAFYNCTSLTSITLPFVGSSLNNPSDTNFGYIFGAYGYYYNGNYVPTRLKEVIITAPCKTIGSDAFRDCTSLTSITIPDSVTSIDDGAFEDCTSLTSITIPDSVTSIGSSAFRYCTGLTSITIPDSVTSIGDYAFYNCTGLTSITIPNSVTSIDDGAFEDCTSLTSITLPFIGSSLNDPSYTNFGYIFGASSYSDNSTYVPESLKEVIITAPCKTIGSHAFFDCDNLTSITIPDSVTSIGDYAFYNCTGLTSITIPDSVISIDDGAFEDCTSLTSITLPFIGSSLNDSSYTDLGYIFGNSYYVPESLKEVIITAPCKTIGFDAFCNCTGLTSITIPDSVTSIDDYAFYDCTSLTSITIPDSVTSIGEGVFGFCLSLTSITIPDSVTSIGSYAFEGCGSLTSITIPDSVTSIGAFAFYNCTSLENIFYAGSKSQWSKSDCGIDSSKTTVHYNKCDGVYKKTVTQRTCTTDSKEFYACACGNTYSKKIAKAYGHDYSKNYKLGKKATLTADGSKYKTCSRCSAKKTAKIYKVSSLKLSSTSYAYDSKAKKPSVTVKDSKGNTLKNGTDYKVTYSSNNAIGTANAKVTLMGNYSGTKTLTFKIYLGATSKITASQTDTSVKLTWNKVAGAKGYKVYVYNSKGTLQLTKTTTKTSVTVGDLSKGTSYKFTVKACTKINGKIVWSEKTKSLTATTKPGTPTVKATAGKGKVDLSWSKQKGANGYVVYMATSKDGKYSKIKTLEGIANIKYTKKGLTSGKTYYFRVRAYQKNSSGTVYGAYKTVAVKVK